ncbi:MAG: ABC transporter substrate-binding protein [Pseudohongiella sp.]|nr:ABC transporter substrate-binding protein [Pseudohongiella sp.]
MKSIFKIGFMGFALLLSSLTLAQTSGSAAAGLSAVEAAEQSVNQLLQTVQELRPYFDSDKDRYYAGVEAEVAKFVDFREVAVGVMARFSEQATEEQILAFGEKLRSTLTRFYGSALVEYGGQQLNFLPAGEEPADPSAGTNVRMQIVSEGARIELQYALFRNADNEWKLRNIFVGGINLRRQYHTQFAALMTRNNNDIDQVIAAWQ